MKQKPSKLDTARNIVAMKLHILKDLSPSALTELLKILSIELANEDRVKYGYITAIRSAVIKETDAAKLRQLGQKLDQFKAAALMKAAWGDKTPTILDFDEWWKTIWEDVEAVDWRHCETCVGTGKLPSKMLGWDDVDCGECDGRGRITVYQLDNKRGTAQELYEMFTPR